MSVTNINWKAILKAFLEILKSIGKGDTLIRLRVDKWFPHILYLFILGWFSIWMSLKVESAMHKVETNKKVIETLKIENVSKTCEKISLTRISTVEDNLKKVKSKVQAPEKPASRIKR